jgi:hypothetical protein
MELKKSFVIQYKFAFCRDRLTSQATRSLRLLGRRYAAPVLSTLAENCRPKPQKQ